MKLTFRLDLNQSLLSKRIAAAIEAEGFRVADGILSGVYFLYDQGDGPGRSGAGLTASVHARGDENVWSLSVELTSEDIRECVRASLVADGYSIKTDGISLKYEASTGSSFEPGNGASASVALEDIPAGDQTRPIAVEHGRMRKVRLCLNQEQIRLRIATALTKLGQTVPRNDWISFEERKGDRFESSSIAGSAIVKFPGNVEGKVALSQSDIKDLLSSALEDEGYVIEKNGVSLNYDSGRNAHDSGNGLIAHVRVMWTVGVTKGPRI